MEDKLDNMFNATVTAIMNLPPDQQYGFLFDALKVMIDMENDSDMLAIVAAQLQELVEMAASKSGYPLIADAGKAIN